MIDFRYHLVSLISVFIALAIGVLLGAGPLRTPLGDTLTGQVAQLRADRDKVNSELEEARTDVNDRNIYIESLASSFLPGTLKEVSVALVVLPETNADDIKRVSDELSKANATITGQVQLTENWATADRQTYRDSLSAQVAPTLSPAPAADADSAEVLGNAVVQMLTQSGDKTKTLTGILTGGSTPLIKILAQPKNAAKTVVVIGPRTANTNSDKEKVAENKVPDPNTWASMVRAISNNPGKGAVIGSAKTDNDLISLIRAANSPVMTVDSVDRSVGAVTLPLALAEAIRGSHNSYGFGKNAKSVVPLLPAKTGGPASSEAGN